MAVITLKTYMRDANVRAFDGHLCDIRPDTLGIKAGDIIKYEVWEKEKPVAHSISNKRFEVTCVTKMLPTVMKGYDLIDMKPVVPRFE